MHERRVEEEAKNNSLLGKIQGAVNDAMYKKKYEEMQKKYTLQQDEFNTQIKRADEKLVEKERELLFIVQTNEKNINTVRE